MPKLVRLYIVNVAIGFGLSVAFVAALVAFDAFNLQRLILGSEMGWLAALMMVMFNGVVFAGVQFAYAVMSMAERDDGPRGGKLVPVRVAAKPAQPTGQARQIVLRRRR